MSFVKKAIKKVVKTVKKIVKSKIFKYIVIAAAIFFTAGIAAGGFAAFSGVSTVGGFFTAVGQTIATGASAIAGGLGFQGASASLAAHGGAAATQAGLVGAAGIPTAAAAATLTPVTTTAVSVGTGAGQAATVAAAQSAAAANAAGSGFLASVKGVLGKKVLGDVSIGQLAASGITTSMTEMIKNKGSRADNPNGFVAGDVARGGGSEAPGAIDYQFGGPESAGLPAQQVAQQPTQAQQQQEEPTVAAQLAQGGQAQPSPANRIQALIAERGPLNSPNYGGGLVNPSLTTPAQGASPRQMLVQVPEPQARPERTFMTPASQLEYERRGLV